LDVAKMNMRTDEEKPVIRTLYDHVSTVTDISWHPGGLALASASEDKSIKIYDLQKPSVKRSFRYLQVCILFFKNNFKRDYQYLNSQYLNIFIFL